MSSHTQGRWSRNIKPASRYPIVFAGRNTHVAQCCTSGLPDAEIEANINLITAAPDLLAALSDILDLAESEAETLTELGRDDGNTKAAAEEAHDRIRVARNAIAKATGAK